jgi:hypothetical protein
MNTPLMGSGLSGVAEKTDKLDIAGKTCSGISRSLCVYQPGPRHKDLEDHHEKG